MPPHHPATHEFDLHPHRSRLPLALYLLSFAPSINETTSWRSTLTHPYVLYTLGFLTAIPAGVAMIANNLLFGYWTTRVTDRDATDAQITARGDQVGWIMTVLGVALMFLIWGFLVCFAMAADNLTQRLRHTYVASIVVQDPPFFEKVGPGEICTLASKDIAAIRTAFGEKLGYLVWSLTTVIAGLSSAFANSPKLGGVLFSLIPFLVIVFGFLNWANNIVGAPANDLEGQTSTLIEQVLSSVRIVQSFNMGSSLIQRLDSDLLKRLQKLGAKRSIIRSLEQSAVYFAVFLTYSLTFWYGGIQVRQGLATGHVMTVFFNYITLLFALANVVPHFTSIADAMVSLQKIRSQIERQPLIDVRDDSGVKLSKTGWKPSFALANVTYAYPSRPTASALKNVSYEIQPGCVTAIVGSSGSGKSTAAALLLRDFDPAVSVSDHSDSMLKIKNDVRDEKTKRAVEARHELIDNEKQGTTSEDEELVAGGGKVLFAGRDVRDYNVRWLRNQTAVVSQNPQLFTATVFENVAAGLTGTDLEYRSDIDGAADAPMEIKERTARIRELCVQALEKAQAWHFVSELPEGMDTIIAGGRNGLLSGGQRQRLVIARALVGRPACILLDEATSALDTDTEENIRVMFEQEVTERGMTAILIAHRLSTVVRADHIIVMKEGCVVDQGRYDELMEENRPNQTFRQLAITQLLNPDHAHVDAAPDAEASQDVMRQKMNSVNSSFAEHGGLVSGGKALETHNTGQAEFEDVEQALSSDLDEPAHHGYMHGFLDLLRSQRWYFIIGTLGGVCAGSSFPIAGWMLGEAVQALSDELARPGINTWSLWFLILSIIDLFTYFINAFYLEVASENTMRKLKRDSLDALIKQEVAFFDETEASAGGLTGSVSTHSSNVGSAIGLVSAQVMIAVTYMLGCLLIGFILDWKMALVGLPTIIFLAFWGWLNVVMQERRENATTLPDTNAAKYVNEIADSIKTVVALGRERETMRLFVAQTPATSVQGGYLIRSAGGIAVGQATMLFCAALFYYWGSRRLADGVPVDRVYAVFEVVFIATFAASRLFTFVGDYGRAMSSFKAIQIWLHRKPKYGTYRSPPSDRSMADDWASGDIVLNHVELRYPQRPKYPALKDINLRFEAGKTHALCGTSGSGKSSILALLQRFYDPNQGTITFGGTDHRELSLDDMRANMAYVSQDPVLFEGTIRWNLALGALDPASVTEEQIRVACEQAHIWSFVCGLENGLDTEIGMKGADLSGGERQRLCIARALIRDPRILLLDEATSALDAESERFVQRALHNASKGRTTITVAHRLSTIRNSNVIHVIEDGCVIETGTHDELLQKRGRYLELVQAQL